MSLGISLKGYHFEGFERVRVSRAAESSALRGPETVKWHRKEVLRRSLVVSVQWLGWKYTGIAH